MRPFMNLAFAFLFEGPRGLTAGVREIDPAAIGMSTQPLGTWLGFALLPRAVHARSPGCRGH